MGQDWGWDLVDKDSRLNLSLRGVLKSGLNMQGDMYSLENGTNVRFAGRLGELQRGDE